MSSFPRNSAFSGWTRNVSPPREEDRPGGMPPAEPQRVEATITFASIPPSVLERWYYTLLNLDNGFSGEYPELTDLCGEVYSYLR